MLLLDSWNVLFAYLSESVGFFCRQGICRKDGRRHKDGPQVKVKVPGMLSGVSWDDWLSLQHQVPGTSLLQHPCFQVAQQEKKDFHLENSRCRLTSHWCQWQGNVFSSNISRNPVQVVKDCFWFPASILSGVDLTERGLFPYWWTRGVMGQSSGASSAEKLFYTRS